MFCEIHIVSNTLRLGLGSLEEQAVIFWAVISKQNTNPSDEHCYASLVLLVSLTYRWSLSHEMVPKYIPRRRDILSQKLGMRENGNFSGKLFYVREISDEGNFVSI